VILEFFIFSAARDLEFYCWGSLFVLFCFVLFCFVVIVDDEWSGGGAIEAGKGV